MIKRMKCWCIVIKCFLASIKGTKCRILTAEETVKTIQTGKSLIRFGDGEFGIYHGRAISYQQCSEKLISEFIQIKKMYEEDPDNCPFIIAVPKYFLEVSGFGLLKKRAFVASWAEPRADFKKYFKQNITYGDAFLFKKANESIFDHIWTDDLCRNNIIFVHNNEKYAESFQDKYHKKVFYVKCPQKNAFESIEIIIDNINKTIVSNSLNRLNTEIVVSAGPAGKVLVKNLSQDGLLCIDTGHCWDYPLIGME